MVKVKVRLASLLQNEANTEQGCYRMRLLQKEAVTERGC